MPTQVSKAPIALPCTYSAYLTSNSAGSPAVNQRVARERTQCDEVEKFEPRSRLTFRGNAFATSNAESMRNTCTKEFLSPNRRLILSHLHYFFYSFQCLVFTRFFLHFFPMCSSCYAHRHDCSGDKGREKSIPLLIPRCFPASVHF